ncbi:GreA/GreB family elongation factor [Umezawaea sp. Da 62-37]|uniref:GreA/GreB family elongation factor n=1 Tax=Umezawaea sp. Da 62-37 TaxID=3075927 RepID=UPI0028F6E7D8|nr:GreA/GreB family elongation factor [Umezawaea sp. Da 62-37]WNV85187.1 GreA/GreB family elongation factor [Umezawaea sp. Da 62-37]
MTGTRSVWLTPDARRRLRAELAGLSTARTTPTPGPRDERIRHIQELLNNSAIDQDPPDDGIAELGMVLTVRYDDTRDTETFLLGMRAVEHGDIEVYSPQSPLGGALIGARPGEQRGYRVPGGGTVRVTLLDAVPYGHHDPDGTL